jgi:soluble lytic murein transglycosylase
MCCRSIVLILVAATVAVVSIPLAAVASADHATLAEQRAAFRAAWKDIRKDDLAALNSELVKLMDYPLYPYLRYAYLLKNIASDSPKAVEDFLVAHPELPVRGRLRYTWLHHLLKEKDWTTFFAHYDGKGGPVLECGAVAGRLALAKTPSPSVIARAKALWLTPNDQPHACDPVFAYLDKHGLLTHALINERARKAIKAGHLSLARYLEPRLTGDTRDFIDAWLKVAHDPATALADLKVPDEGRYRELMIYGLRRVAGRDLDKAESLWRHLDHDYRFSAHAHYRVARRFALEAAWQHRPDAAKRLAALSHHDSLATQWRIRTALLNGDWQTVPKAVAELPSYKRHQAEWQYWRARALAKRGDAEDADRIYRQLAGEMNYYGFLAADRLHQPYAIKDTAVEPDETAIARLAKISGLVRARELFKVGRYRWASLEWRRVARRLNSPTQCQAGLLAHRWGLAAAAARALANGGCWTNLTLSYPIAFRALLRPAIKKLQLDPAWVFGVVRAESLFAPGAVSRAGALGLMQLMPATGRQAAKRLGIDIADTDDLLDPATNLTLGSHYLDKMSERFDGSEVLATAAYNAGPYRVQDWLPSSADMSADVWVDTIPYGETRRYIRRVLAYAVIFDWRMDDENVSDVKRLSRRLGAIGPANAAGAPVAMSDTQ